MPQNRRVGYVPARTRRDKDGNVTVEGGYIRPRSELAAAAYNEGKKATKRSKPQRNSRSRNRTANAARGAVLGAAMASNPMATPIIRTIEQARAARRKKAKNRAR